MVFGLYALFLAVSIIQGEQLINPVLGILIIGVPAFIYACKGRFSWVPRTDGAWVQQLIRSGDTAAIEVALKAVTDVSSRPTVAECSKAFVATQIVVAMGRPPVLPMSHRLRKWSAEHAGLLSMELRQLALQALERIANYSDLQLLWAQRGRQKEFANMIGVVRDALIRVSIAQPYGRHTFGAGRA